MYAQNHSSEHTSLSNIIKKYKRREHGKIQRELDVSERIQLERRKLSRKLTYAIPFFRLTHKERSCPR